MKKKKEKRKKAYCSQEPELFSDNGKNKIRMGSRKKKKLLA